MNDTRKDDEVARSKSAIRKALGPIVGTDEIGIDGIADEPDGEAKAEVDLPTQRASCPSGR